MLTLTLTGSLQPAQDAFMKYHGSANEYIALIHTTDTYSLQLREGMSHGKTLPAVNVQVQNPDGRNVTLENALALSVTPATSLDSGPNPGGRMLQDRIVFKFTRMLVDGFPQVNGARSFAVGRSIFAIARD
jgi:hypothetical protein